MPDKNSDTVIAAVMEQLMAENPQAMAQIVTVLMNLAMRMEREQFLAAGHYERAPDRRGYANGTKSKLIDTLAGTYVLTESAQRLATLANSSLAEDVALQIIVDAMKTPWMAGQPTMILLEAIGERFDAAPTPADGAGYWDVIEWIAASHPEIDLVTPPENPYAN
jgi:hypothetical protein